MLFLFHCFRSFDRFLFCTFERGRISWRLCCGLDLHGNGWGLGWQFKSICAFKDPSSLGSGQNFILLFIATNWYFRSGLELLLGYWGTECWLRLASPQLFSEEQVYLGYCGKEGGLKRGGGGWEEELRKMGSDYVNEDVMAPQISAPWMAGICPHRHSSSFCLNLHVVLHHVPH